MPTVKIKFTRDTRSVEGGPHKEGDTLECSDASAARWVKRDAAQVVESEAKSVASPPQDKAVKSPPKDKAVKPKE
ncbi:MAG: hypothetical protein AAGI37_15495 [Planctomycetota bacterium]